MDPKRTRPSGEHESSAGTSSEARLRAARHAPAQSGKYGVPYITIREILLRYLSGILVDSVLDKALSSRNVSPASLSPAVLSEMTSDIMVGLRLFVAEERLPQLMLELAEALDPEHP